MPGTPSPRRWLFLGVLIDVLTEPGAPVTVAEGILPEGASRRRMSTRISTTASTSSTAVW